MVQKLTKAYNKLGFQANITLKLDNKQAIKKPSLQIHSVKSFSADSKAVKLKKSRSVMKANIDVGDVGFRSSSKTYETPHKTPTKTPSPKKPSPYKSLHTSPNYMKSTSSSEARKGNSIKVSNTKSTTSKLHKVAKTLAKSSSLKKIRTLTNPPSFKHTRATCSSTLKDSKFPNYLKLNPGATEAEGDSTSKVCPYTYCSLNGHHHVSLPPLKHFLSSKRRIIKSLKSKPEVNCLTTKAKEDQNEGFFVEIFVSSKEIDTQVSHNNINQFEDDEDLTSTLVQKEVPFESDEETNSSSSVSIDDFICQNSDMDWEEGYNPDAYDASEIYVQKNYYSEDNQGKLEFECNKSASGKLEFLDDESSQQFQDEIIVECFNFSDVDSSSDSESTQIGEKLVEELVMVTDHTFSKEYEITEHAYLPNEATETLEEKSTDEHCTIFSKTLDEMQLFNVISDDNSESDSNLNPLVLCNKLSRSKRCKKAEEDTDEEKEFNPKGPNFLPIESEQEAEKVDLRHQEMDQRRSAEEWMLDYALQKTVNQLAAARKRKVALLVEAFESVIPIPKCVNHVRRNSSGFARAIPIEACS